MSSKRKQQAPSRKGDPSSHQAPGVVETPSVVGKQQGANLNQQEAISPLVTLVQSVKIAILVGTLSFALVASQLALHPLYGSTTSSLYLKHVLIVSCLVSTVVPAVPAHYVFQALSVLLAFAPLSAKHLGGWFGRWDSAMWGPILTQIPLAASFAGLSCMLLQEWLVKIVPPSSQLGLNRIPLALVLLGAHLIEPLLWSNIPFGGVVTSCNMFLSLSIVASLCAISTTPSKNSKAKNVTSSLSVPIVVASLSLAIAAYSKLHSPCTPPHLPATYTSVNYPPTNASIISQIGSRLGLMAPTDETPRNVTVKLLARSDSVTGTIVVGEYAEMGFRYLRADHSILGGRWILNSNQGPRLGESIYGAFTLQEAIRLIERDEKEGENALVIGLGIGIAAEALMAHGNKVHVVEIDPSVYAYACVFFNLAEPHAVHLVDARGWVHEKFSLFNAPSAQVNIDLELNKFSLVVHDCFSGGGVPSHIFTLEFWEELKGIMTTDGALAVNFAGHLGSEAARAIWFTLQEAFAPKNGGRGCRVFHDSIGDNGQAGEIKKDEFLNMVFFCQKNNGEETPSQVNFRKPRESDYLRSRLRKTILSTVLDREVPEDAITGLSGDSPMGGKEWILTDGHNRLGDWQHDTAVEHWGVMRHVMPYNVWEVY
ncbi:hypothetical protein M408DRAFT_172974 [Serendipita vermifera MAFF 305830]|uniref:PABS domain-containing protein n=1 Tax=Serendipita vermifera MAFF 305830 TaxID=933852 RepID=A0A0C3AR78_SERVB|nr:hypothetical protein M408DRAFT_172974 [Serendipita vermifera MAFF 305830]